MFDARRRPTPTQRLVLTAWPLASASACLVTKQCLMVFGRHAFPVWTGIKKLGRKNVRCLVSNVLRAVK